jgi:hypothetical protein
LVLLSCAGVCDCCDGGDEVKSEINSWGPSVSCPNVCDGQRSAPPPVERQNPHVVKLESVITSRREKTAKRRDNMHMLSKDKGIQRKKPKLGLSSRTLQRAGNFVWWLAVLAALAMLPLTCMLCASDSVQIALRKAFHNCRVGCLYVLQRCGCSKVQTTYTISKDETHMV